MPLRTVDRQVIDRATSTGERMAPRLDLAPATWFAGRMGTAATLLALNGAHGATFYDVAPEAATDPDAADAAFAAQGPVIDVQTHLVRPSRATTRAASALFGFLQMVDAERWTDPVDLTQLSAPAWAACVFGGSETSVALLTSTPGEPGKNVIDNADIAAAREIMDRYAGTGRVLGHTIVHPNLGPAELDRMEGWRDDLRPSGWKVYTLWDPPGSPGQGWFLDDERTGIPFLERVSALGPPIVCAHKGIAGPIPSSAPAAASPRDIGPAAARFPDIQFVVYHSGYDPDPTGEEGSHADDPDRGVSRLVTSLTDGRHRSRAQRLGRAGLDLVPDAAASPRGRPRARQAAAGGRARADPVGHRLGLVRPAAVADRRVPHLHHPRVDAGAVRLSRRSPRTSGPRSSAATPPACTGSRPRRRPPTRPGWPRPDPSSPADWRRSEAASDLDLRRTDASSHRGPHRIAWVSQADVLVLGTRRQRAAVVGGGGHRFAVVASSGRLVLGDLRDGGAVAALIGGRLSRLRCLRGVGRLRRVGCLGDVRRARSALRRPQCSRWSPKPRSPPRPRCSPESSTDRVVPPVGWDLVAPVAKATPPPTVRAPARTTAAAMIVGGMVMDSGSVRSSAWMGSRPVPLRAIADRADFVTACAWHPGRRPRSNRSIGPAV